MPSRWTLYGGALLLCALGGHELAGLREARREAKCTPFGTPLLRATWMQSPSPVESALPGRRRPLYTLSLKRDVALPAIGAKGHVLAASAVTDSVGEAVEYHRCEINGGGDEPPRSWLASLWERPPSLSSLRS